MKRMMFMLSLVFVLIVSGCGSDAGSTDSAKQADKAGASTGGGDTLIVSIPEEVGTLDPGVSMDNAEWKIIYPTYERLVDYDGSSTEVKPALASSWEISDDGLTYTFTLEEGHQFADGGEVDAEAVKFSFERTLEIGKGPSELYEIINEIKVIDPYTVEFKLDNEFPPFLSTLAANYGAIVNPAVIEENEKDGDLAQEYLASHTMGSGPYILEEYEKGQYYKLTANPNSQVEPELKTVYFQVSSDVAGERLKLEKGEIHIAEGLPVDQVKEMESVKGVEVITEPSLLVDYVYMNIGKGTEALKNKTFRQGLSHAVHYESMIAHTLQGLGSPFIGPVPEGLWGHDPDAKVYEYDPDKAKQLIKESGFEKAELTLLYSDHRTYWEQMALAIQNDLKEVNVMVKLEKVAYPTMREMIDTGDFDLALGIWMPDYGDPFMFMNHWFDSDSWGLAGNRSFYKNDEVDQLIRQAASTSEQEEREALYKEAQEIVNEDAVYLYLAQQDFVLPMRENVKGFVFNPMLQGIYNLADMSVE